MEPVANVTSDKMDKLKLEEFHEFVRRFIDTFIKNLTLTKDNTYNNIKNSLIIRILLFRKVIKTQV